MNKRLIAGRTPVLLALCAVMALSARADLVGQVGFDKQLFNPSQGECIVIRYELTQAAKVTLTLHDPDGRLIRTLVSGASQPAGLQMATWDGKDDAGVVVPDEAYYPVLRVEGADGGSVTLDPSQDSGGEMLTGIEASYDAARGVVKYVLPESARVRVLAGIADGPLLATVIPNLPRPAGLCEEPWNAMDDSGRIKVTERSGWQLRVEAFRLPRWAILAQGNAGAKFTDYTLASMRKGGSEPPGHQLLALARKPRVVGSERLSPFASQSRILDQPPQFNVAVVGTKEAPEIEVALDPLTASLLNEVRFEVVFYLDFKRMGEEEQAYSPMRFAVPTGSVAAGRHWLTVNVASLTGQLGTQTLEIEIDK